MTQNTKQCPYCGAIVDSNDVSCHECKRAFAKETVIDTPVIDGIDNNELKEFIGKNSDYYLQKFKKSGDKKYFFQLNFPSLLFSQHWLFYRKMYKVGIMFMVLTILFTSLLNIGLSAIFKGAVTEYYSTKEAYIAYNEKDVDMFITNEDGYTVENPEYDHSYSRDLKKSQDKIRTISFFINLPAFIFNILFRLLGNCFYKKHITENIGDKSKGGTSQWAVVISMVLFSAVNTAVSAIVFNIPVVAAFQEALDSLYGWL